MLFADQGFLISSRKNNAQFRFVGGTSAAPELEAKTSAVSNYLLGNDRSKWLTGISQFEKLRYRNLYPGIDLLFYGNDNRFEHDFIVAPGADYHAIRLQIEGLTRAHIDANGDLVIGSGESATRMQKPVAYQLQGVRKIIRESRFTLVANTISFEVVDHDPTKALFIDPVFVYSTYLGSDQGDSFGALTADAAGNAYVTGLTWSMTFPTTASAFQTTCASCPTNPDIYVVKLNATGTQMLYATYIGGNDYDWPRAIAVDGNGVVGIAGTTQSLDFPSIRPMFDAGTGYPYERGFILSLSTDGTALNFSSRTPPQSPASGVAFDSSNNLYFVGTTTNTAFPTTPGTLPVTAPPSYPTTAIYAVKLGSDGTKLYSALIQAASPNSGFSPGFVGAKADASGDLVIAGQAGNGLPTTPGAYQTAWGGNYGYDAFALKLNPQASALLFSTYIGGSNDDRVSAFDLAPDGSVIIVGSASAGFPLTTGSTYKFPTNDCCGGGYIAKLSSDGTTLLRSTIIGTSDYYGYAGTYSVTVDSTGKIYVGGYTGSDSFPLVRPVATQNLTGSGAAGAGFIIGFDPDITQLQFSTYFTGGTDSGRPLGLAVDAAGHLFVGGMAAQGLFTTPGVVKPSVSSYHTFVSVLDLSVSTGAICPNPKSVYLTPVVGTTYSQNVTLTNCGDADLHINSVSVTGDPAFTQLNDCTNAIPTGQTCTVQVSFSPVSRANAVGKLVIAGDVPIPIQIPLTGVGRQAILENVVFQHIQPTLMGTSSGERESFFANTGDAPMHVTGVLLDANPDFTLRHECDPAREISPPNGNTTYGCSYFITFTPTSAGAKSATLTVTSDAEGSPQTFTIQATALAAYPVPQIGDGGSWFFRTGDGPKFARIFGSGFFPQSTLLLDGIPHAFTFREDWYIDVEFSAADLATMGEKTLQVSNPTPGGGTSNPAYLMVYATVPATVADLAYDPYARRLIGTSPAGATNAHSLLFIDPVTRMLAPSLPLGPNTDPRKLALSQDGKFAYVGLDGTHEIARVDLRTRTKLSTIALANESGLGLPVRVGDMKVSPVDSNAIVASLLRNASPSEAGMVYIKGNTVKTRLQNDFSNQYVSVDSFVFAPDGTTLYGLDSYYGFGTFKINADMLSRQSEVTLSGSLVYGSLFTDGASIFSGTGYKVDPANPNTPFGHFANLAFSPIVADRGLQRVFGITFGKGLTAFDPNTFQELATVMGASGSFLTRWGKDGFALSTFSGTASAQDTIVLFRSARLLALPGGGTATLSSLGTTSRRLGGANLDLTVTGTGFVPGAVVNWNTTELTTEFIDSTHVIGKVGGAELGKPGKASITVTNPGSAASNALFFTVTTASRSDFNGDGKAEPAVWRPSSGTWYAKPGSAPDISQQWGAVLSGVSDVPVPGDYDGDGKTDFAVWRPGNGTWYVLPSTNPSKDIEQQWGAVIGGVQDIPVPADYDGDGITDFAVWRPSNGTWYIIPSSNPSKPIQQQWGAILNGVQDIPVPGDYDSDGKADFAVWRPGNGTWYILPSTNPSKDIEQQWGAVLNNVQDIPVPADYDGDGKTDFAVWRPSNGTWYIIPSSNPSSLIQQQWGTTISGVADIPLPADYDSDGKADIAVWRPSEGTWFIRPSTAPGTYTMTQWGLPTDKPVPNVPFAH